MNTFKKGEKFTLLLLFYLIIAFDICQESMNDGQTKKEERQVRAMYLSLACVPPSQILMHIFAFVWESGSLVSEERGGGGFL